jgi:Superfamily II DNA helicase
VEQTRRTNATIRLTPCRNDDKGRLLLSRLPEKPEGTEVYRVRDDVAAKGSMDMLKRIGRDVRILAPLQSPPEQLQTESWFQGAPRPALILVGNTPPPTCRDDIRSFYIMNLPPTLSDAEADLEAVGRDGLAAEIEFFASGKDREHRLEAIRRDHPENTRRENIARLNDVVTWMEHDGCARVALARLLHGIDVGVCGNCGWCLGRPAAFLPNA